MMSRAHPRSLCWPVLIYATLLLVSSRSELAAPSGLNFQIDKLAHFAVYGALATSLIRLPRIWSLGRGGAVLTMVLVSVLGGLDELWQSRTPGRFMEFGDWIADTLGGLTAVLLYRHWPGYRRLLETQLFTKRAMNMPSPSS